MSCPTKPKQLNWERAEAIASTLQGEFDASDIARAAQRRGVELTIYQSRYAVGILRRMGLLTPATRRKHYTYNVHPSLAKTYRPLHPH